MSNLQVVNQEIFHSFIGDDEVEAERMANLFIVQAQSYAEELKKSFNHDSEQEWHDVAHKIKGMAGFSGTERLREVSYTAQKGWKKKREQKEKMLSDIESEMQKAIDFFQSQYGVS